MKCERLKISDFSQVITGGTPSTSKKEYWENGSIPWLNSGELNQNIIETCENKITELGLKNSSSRIMPPDTVLIALTGTTTGVVGYLTFEACANQSVTGILPSSKHHPKYLYYYLKSIRSKILEESYGGAQKHISQGYVKDLEIPLPPLETQERIADLLDVADALRKKDQELLKKYDELAQAIFIEMFGDPVKNEKGWDVIKFEKLGSLDRGISKHRPRNAPELLGGDYPLIQTGDVANSKGLITNFRSTYSELGLKQSKLWPKGTLCITIAANIAKTGILQIDACFPDSIVGFIPNPNLTNSIFIQFWIGFLQKILEDNAPESAQKNINLEILRGLDVICPPEELQYDFSERISQLISIKDVNPIIGSDKLFNSLIQKAFKGELV